MGIVLLFARLFLALVFGAAGIAKAVDAGGSRRAMIGFGVPERLASPLALSLPYAEILIALALLPLTSAWLGAIAACALLFIFAVGITVSLARGRSPDCHCFGQIHSKPVSWSTFARNLALMALAGLIVVLGRDNPGMSAFSWLADLKAGEVVNLVLSIFAVALVAAVFVYLRRVLSQQSTLLERIEKMKKVIDEDYAEPPLERADAAAPLEGLPVGAPAPSFSLAGIGGEQVLLDDLLAYGKAVLLLFVSPNCLPCETLLPAVKVWERDYDSQLTIALLSKGELEENQVRVAKYGARHLLLQGESAVAQNYQTRWTPAAVIVSRNGRIASRVAYGDEAIRELTAQAVSKGAAGNGHGPQIAVGTSSFRVGDRAPAFSISDLEGELVNLEDLLGGETLLLFWDPGCPFCRAMSDDLRRWEENPPKSAPRLVFVASGDLERIKAGSKIFKSRFLYDQEFEIGPLFGTTSTPSAVVIDHDGRIASSMAIGLPNVLALAGVRKAVLPIASNY